MDKGDIIKLHNGLNELVDFFAARDRMNAVVHLAEPRWSPITELAIELRDLIREYI